MPASTAFATLAALHEQMAAAYRELAAQEPVIAPDRAVGLAEAAVRLGCSKAWLTRRSNYERVGGYIDADRRVKFSMAALEAWVRAKGRA